MYDTRGKGSLTPPQFAAFLSAVVSEKAATAMVSRAKSYTDTLQARGQQVRGGNPTRAMLVDAVGHLVQVPEVSKDDFHAFHSLLASVDELETALTLLSQANGEVTAVQFHKAVNAAIRANSQPGNALSRNASDLIFALFDTNDDGSLKSKGEVLDVLRVRKHHGLDTV